MQGESGRRAKLTELDRVIREASAFGQLFSAAIAAKVGLAGADIEYLDILTLKGRMTAGELAAATGLTTGAVTGVIDRLERSGFARRQRDTSDRRRVFVVARPDGLERLRSFYAPMANAMAELAERYSESEIDAFLGYFSAARDIMRDSVARVRARSPRRGEAGASRRRARRPRRSSPA